MAVQIWRPTGRRFPSVRQASTQMVGASDAHWTSQLEKYATMVPGVLKTWEEFVAALHKGGLKPAIYEEGARISDRGYLLGFCADIKRSTKETVL